MLLTPARGPRDERSKLTCPAFKGAEACPRLASFRLVHLVPAERLFHPSCAPFADGDRRERVPTCASVLTGLLTRKPLRIVEVENEVENEVEPCLRLREL